MGAHLTVGECCGQQAGHPQWAVAKPRRSAHPDAGTGTDEFGRVVGLSTTTRAVSAQFVMGIGVVQATDSGEKLNLELVTEDGRVGRAEIEVLETEIRDVFSCGTAARISGVSIEHLVGRSAQLERPFVVDPEPCGKRAAHTGIVLNNGNGSTDLVLGNIVLAHQPCPLEAVLKPRRELDCFLGFGLEHCGTRSDRGDRN